MELGYRIIWKDGHECCVGYCLEINGRGLFKKLFKCSIIGPEEKCESFQPEYLSLLRRFEMDTPKIQF